MSARKNTECGQKQAVPSNGAIYCCGPLLRAVQLAGLYKDSKYFVDMTCRYSPERILADYQLFSSCKKNETSVKHLTNFVDNHFDQPGTEMDYWSPPDWRCEPCFLKDIKDPQLRKFASDLNRIWKQLGRNMKDCVRTSPLMYSLIYVPNPLIVPGGRFLEYYYWDTYWIVRGLLHSGMIQTARGMIDNLLYLVQMYKSVPGGGRIYYWGRSQPPMLTFMVKAYVEITKDEKYAVRALPLLETEMDNFLKSHSVQVEGRTMYQYRDKSSGPRPEFYREDLASAESFACPDEKEEHFGHLKSACESGMDFSSRWFVSPTGSNVGTLANIKTNWIVPVDLNCLLFRSCKMLAEFNTQAGKTAQAQNYRNIACGLIKAITAVLWNEERGVWLDFDLKNKMPRDYFVVTNLSPLFYRAYPIADADKITKSVMAYIEENKLDTMPGGVPHTLSNTGQKWDYPNVFPPMMHMLIEGLNNLGTPEAVEMAQRWQLRWVRSNYEAFSKTGFMFEKYNCEEAGRNGTGADCPSQTGFGWTNGVIIEMLAKNGSTLTACDAPANQNACSCSDTENQDTSLENCPITSMAYLEKKGDDCDANDDAQSDDEAANCPAACNAPDPVESFATSEQTEEPCCPNAPEPPCGGNQAQQGSGAASPGGQQRDSKRASNGGQPNTFASPCGICFSNAQPLAPGQGPDPVSNGGQRGSQRPSQGSAQRPSQGSAQRPSQGSAQGAPQGAPQGASQRGSQRVSQGAAQAAAQAAAQITQSPCGICSADKQQANAARGSGAASPGGQQRGSQGVQDIPRGPFNKGEQQQTDYQGSPCDECNDPNNDPYGQQQGYGQQGQPQNDQQADEDCSVCCGQCAQSGQAAASACPPEPKPIEIEIEDIKCLMDLSPSEMENALDSCQCDSNAGESDCEDSDENADGCKPVKPKPVVKNKLFPLADEVKCPLPKPEESENGESLCTCDKSNARASKAEKDGD